MFMAVKADIVPVRILMQDVQAMGTLLGFLNLFVMEKFLNVATPQMGEHNLFQKTLDIT